MEAIVMMIIQPIWIIKTTEEGDKEGSKCYQVRELSFMSMMRRD